MKKPIRILLGVLVLFTIAASPSYCDSRGCRESFDPGKLYAKRLHRSWGWYPAGAASVVLGSWAHQGARPRALPDISRLQPESQALGGKHNLPGVFIPVTHSTGSAFSLVFAPAILVRPKPKAAPGPEAVDLDCHRAGYVHEARRKNQRQLYWGGLTVLAPLISVAGVVSALQASN